MIKNELFVQVSLHIEMLLEQLDRLAMLTQLLCMHGVGTI